MQRKNNGFTLIELMIVVAICGILLAVGIESWKKNKSKRDMIHKFGSEEMYQKKVNEANEKMKEKMKDENEKIMKSDCEKSRDNTHAWKESQHAADRFYCQYCLKEYIRY